jgi:NADPH:quinone reductase-like Zn-dependent oxidoreductase
LKSQKKTVFLDCVGGQFAGNLFNSLSLNSVMVNYGRLSKEHLQGVDLGELYFSNKKIRGFWMSTYLK